MKRISSDGFIAFFLILVSIFLYYHTYEIPAPRFEPLGSAFFPRLILGAIVLLSLLLMVQSLVLRTRATASRERDEESTPNDRLASSVYHLCGTLLLFGTYLLLISITDLSYLVLTFVFLLLFGWFLESWKWRVLPRALAAALAITLVIYIIFGRLLTIFFP